MTVQPPLEQLGRWLVVAGIGLVALGALLTFSKTLRLGSLPGDVHMSGRGWQLWLPLGTSLLLSLVLTLILNLFFRRR